MTDSNAFQLSRIYSQGWSAARAALAANPAGVEASEGSLNPHDTAAKRARWSEGFQAALLSRGRLFNTPGGSSWRPTTGK